MKLSPKKTYMKRLAGPLQMQDEDRSRSQNLWGTNLATEQSPKMGNQIFKL